MPDICGSVRNNLPLLVFLGALCGSGTSLTIYQGPRTLGAGFQHTAEALKPGVGNCLDADKIGMCFKGD